MRNIPEPPQAAAEREAGHCDWFNENANSADWKASPDFVLERVDHLLEVHGLEVVIWDTGSDSVEFQVLPRKAAQAPAGEDIFGDFDEANYKPDFASAIAAEIMGLTWTHAPSVGEDGGDGEQMYRYGDVQEAVSRVLEAARTKTHSVHLGKDLVPAQSNPAGPVGEEALREALAVIAFAQTIDDHYDRLEFLKGWSEGDVSEWPEFGSFLADQPHPTTGQETVATPRDGGVREALAEVARLRHALTQIADKRHSEGGEPFDDALDIADATLSAPGSAGPGEHIQHVKSGGWYEVLTRDAQVQTSEPLANYAFVAVYRNIITGATWVRPVSEMDDGRFRPAPAHPAALAAPSPAQEPGTGDTGEGIKKQCADYGGIPARCLITERNWAPGVTPTRCKLCPDAPATKAETPGPADQTKGGL